MAIYCVVLSILPSGIVEVKVGNHHVIEVKAEGLTVK